MIFKNAQKTKLLPENEIIKSLRPTIRHYTFFLVILALCLYLAFTKSGIHTTKGFSIAFISGFLGVYTILSVFTTKYVITCQAVLIKKGPFSLRFTEVNYSDIDSIFVRQGKIQKYFKTGNLIINAERIRYVLRGIKDPFKIKEIINKEKASYHEKRALMKKIL
ncbi:MAG: PH domain-containing protein [Candidatus Loosdrechtia sp.]|uniref:PH domain-containing protein n=1 Tax=Candidatus Loosdrechtia sp. TaxID=3101272 RepID=UPI003A7379B6|nr:MAG: PH domain-containing protein [Candidatus Jettenia sp. AMX2]WKZ22058.1 MAG: PH domain-containing protein [Candidatus Jettenia sp. AMX2]